MVEKSVCVPIERDLNKSWEEAKVFKQLKGVDFSLAEIIYWSLLVT